jgi:hypothetical protein
MGAPGTTKAITLGNAWQQFAALVDPVNAPDIKVGAQPAGSALFSCTVYAMQIAFAETTPLSAGHPMETGEHMRLSYGAYRLAWVKNNTAGSNAVMIVTPEVNT